MKNLYYFLLLSLLTLISCSKHETQKVLLNGFKEQKEVKYVEGKFTYSLGVEDYINYLTDKDKKTPLYNGYLPIVKYIENQLEKSIVISEETSPLSGSIIQVYNKGRDSVKMEINIYPSDNFRWAIINFAKKGKIKIYDSEKNYYLDCVIIDEVKSSASEWVILKRNNGEEIFSQMIKATSY